MDVLWMMVAAFVTLRLGSVYLPTPAEAVSRSRETRPRRAGGTAWSH